MGEKAKVQIQKAKPEKETESEMLHGLVYPAVISGRKRKRSWQRKKSWQWKKDTTWNRGHSAFHEHGKQKYFGDMQNQERQRQQRLFFLFLWCGERGWDRMKLGRTEMSKGEPGVANRKALSSYFLAKSLRWTQTCEKAFCWTKMLKYTFPVRLGVES